jgi:lysozyme
MASRFKKSAGVAALAATFVGGFEGVRTVAYYDPPGIPTICFGETRGVKMGDTATIEKCKAMLNASLDGFSAAIDKCLPAAIPDKTYVAFLSAAYNIGEGAFCGSSMAKRANAGNLTGACDALPLWNKVTMGGVKVALPGITRRRNAERALCLEGVAEGVKLKW